VSECLVVYATRHGATAEIAEALAEALRGAGHDTRLRPADEVETLEGYEAVILGGAGLLDKSGLGFREKAVVAALQPPGGDFRDWDAIVRYGAEIAEWLSEHGTDAADGWPR
jgi:menaquinone-dependent protoporphyrinogen IX oxidase